MSVALTLELFAIKVCGGADVQLHSPPSRTEVLDGDEQLHAPAALPLGKEHSFDEEGGWGPEAVRTPMKRTNLHLSSLG
jgi:hypothetical protein